MILIFYENENAKCSYMVLITLCEANKNIYLVWYPQNSTRYHRTELRSLLYLNPSSSFFEIRLHANIVSI